MPNQEILSKALTQEELMEYSQLIVDTKLNPERLKELKYKVIHYPPPSWEEYYGSNHNRISSTLRCGGMVSMARHIGRPLSPELWEDLVHRMGISGLWILRHGESQWCITCPCIIQLDENNLVKDIQFGARFI